MRLILGTESHILPNDEDNEPKCEDQEQRNVGEDDGCLFKKFCCVMHKD